MSLILQVAKLPSAYVEATWSYWVKYLKGRLKMCAVKQAGTCFKTAENWDVLMSWRIDRRDLRRKSCVSVRLSAFYSTLSVAKII
jgi:hypothetical protein